MRLDLVDVVVRLERVADRRPRRRARPGRRGCRSPTSVEARGADVPRRAAHELGDLRVVELGPRRPDPGRRRRRPSATRSSCRRRSAVAGRIRARSRRGSRSPGAARSTSRDRLEKAATASLTVGRADGQHVRESGRVDRRARRGAVVARRRRRRASRDANAPDDRVVARSRGVGSSPPRLRLITPARAAPRRGSRLTISLDQRRRAGAEVPGRRSTACG